MKRPDPDHHARALRAALLSTLLVAACASSGAGTSPAAPDAEAMAAAQLELAGPGPEHELLAELAGTWTTANTLRVAPDAEPVVESGRTVARTILGGRFLELESSGEMFGQPVASRTLLGFDRRRGLWTLVGLDTMGTYWVTAEGERGADGVIRMDGTDPEPMGEQVYRFELALDPPDRWELRVLFRALGEVVYDPPFTVVETVAQRAPGG